MPSRLIPRLILVGVLLCVGLGAADSTARFEKDSHSLMCVCGCNQLLGECDHVGCPALGSETAMLASSIARGDSDNAIFHEFQDQYGPIALAAPMFTRWNHFAWILPPLVLFLAIAAAMLLVRRWRLRSVPMRSGPRTVRQEALRDRIRSETEL